MVHGSMNHSDITFGDHLIYGRPVKLFQERCYMVALSGAEYDASTMVENFLQTVSLGLITASVNGQAI